jgi:hypothetical protein
MANITVESYPAGAEFANNDVVFSLKTTNMYSTEGVKAVLILILTDIWSATGHFTLSWGTNSVTFTLVASPDESGSQIRYASPGEDLNLWGADFVESMKSNYLLSRDFDIVGGAGATYSIELTAKEYGGEYTLALSDNNITYLTEDDNTAGVTPILRENYKLLARVIMKSGFALLGHSSEDIYLGEDRLTPDTDGYADFDVKGYLKPEMQDKPVFLFPETLSDFLIDRTDQCRQFFIRYTEIYEGLARRIYSTEENKNFILAGGIDFIKMAKYHEDSSSFWDMMQYNKDFLTWQPVTKKVWPRQPEKLYFLVWDADTDEINLKVKIYYTDDTTHTFTKASETAYQYSLWECVVSYNKLDLISLPESANKEIEKYEIWIEDQDDTKISVSRFFELDRKVYTNARIFIFRNSLSGFDTIRCTGETIKSTELTRTVVETLNDFDFTSLNPQIRNDIAFEQQVYKASTGFITKEYAEYLREFELSSEVYEFILNRLYPVILTSKKSEIHKDNSHLHYREFEYARAYKDSHYSYDDNLLGSKNFNKSFNSSYLTGEWHGS